MQTARILQAVVLMMIVALAASCAASKEYSSILFSQKKEAEKDSQSVRFRFLELDKLETYKDGWVTTDIITGKDTANKTLALDNLAKTFPAVTFIIDTVKTVREENTVSGIIETKPILVAYQPIVKIKNSGNVRNKRIRE